MANQPDVESVGRDEARDALESMGSARRRLWRVPNPDWLFWGLAACMVVAGLAALLPELGQMVLQGVVLVAIFVLVFVAQRRSGVVTRLTRPPARPLRWWIALFVAVGASLALSEAAEDAGHESLPFWVLAILIPLIGPRLQNVLGRTG
jgi:hypothetical protein